MLIRRARPDEAAEICDVLRRSIAELCGADHHDDPAILRRWLANKTPKSVESWIADSDNDLLVAVEGDTVLAVGAVRNDGEITLNYVSPDARFKGASRAMLAQLEVTARDRGNDVWSVPRQPIAFICLRAMKTAGCRRENSARRHPFPC